MPTRPQNSSAYHFGAAEQGIADLGKLGPDDALRLTEILVALTHAVLAIAAMPALPPAADPRTDEQRFGQDH